MKPKWRIEFDKAADSFMYAKGIKSLESIAAKDGDLYKDPTFLELLGLLYDHEALKFKGKKRLKYENKALSLYKEALKITPDSVTVIWGFARVYWHRGSKKALPYARKAYRLAKKQKQGVGMQAQAIGLCYETLGNLKLAEQWLKRGAKEDPNEMGVYVNLVTFYEQHEIDTPDLAKLKKKLYTIYQKQPAVWKKTKFAKHVKTLTN